jgi:hypothetical protein
VTAHAAQGHVAADVVVVRHRLVLLAVRPIDLVQPVVGVVAIDIGLRRTRAAGEVDLAQVVERVVGVLGGTEHTWSIRPGQPVQAVVDHGTGFVDTAVAVQPAGQVAVGVVGVRIKPLVF